MWPSVLDTPHLVPCRLVNGKGKLGDPFELCWSTWPPRTIPNLVNIWTSNPCALAGFRGDKIEQLLVFMLLGFTVCEVCPLYVLEFVCLFAPFGVGECTSLAMIESSISAWFSAGGQKTIGAGLWRCCVLFCLVSVLGHLMESYIALKQSSRMYRVMSSLVYQGGRGV